MGLDQLLLIFRVCRWLGAWPLDAAFRPSPRCIFPSVGTAVALAAYSLYQLNQLRPDFASISLQLRHLILGLSPLLNLWQLYTSRHRFSYTVQVLKQCEESGLACGSYDWRVLASTGCGVVFLVGHALLSAGLQGNFDTPGLLFLGLGCLSLQLVQLQFSSLLRLLSSMFARLTSTVQLSSRKRHLEAVAKYHHLLANVGDHVESAYSIQVVTWLSLLYVSLVNSSLEAIKGFLGLLKALKGNSNIQDVGLGLALSLSSLIYSFSQFHSSAYYCQTLSKEVKKTNKVLYRAILGSNRKQLMSSGKLKLQLEMDRELKITACGMFPLDYTMVHSVAASAAVFLVIISQFDA